MKTLRLRLALLSCLALFCLCASTEVRADPVAITSGFWTNSGTSVQNHAVMSGDGIAINLQSSGGHGLLTGPYNPGRLLSISFGTSGPDVITVNGYSNTNPLYGVNGTFEFAGGSFVVPDTLNPTIVMPFTFTGHVIAQTATAPLIEFVNANLTGQGTATLNFISFDVGGQRIQQLQSVTYTFAPAAPAVPEPATLLLLGSGLIGALAHARRRKQKAESSRQ